MWKLKFLICVLFLANTAFSQEKLLTGTVNSVGDPLPGATIWIVGTQKGTQTDELGKFSIKAKINDTLLISYLGKIDYKFKVENYNSVSIDLIDSPQQIKEIYWQEPRKKVKKINAFVVIDNVAMDKNYNIEKELNKIFKEEITDATYLPNPLYIINDIEYSEESLFSKNPTSPYAPLDKQEITETNILKPTEATFFYGKKGVNGIVIITTKNGKPAEKQ